MINDTNLGAVMGAGANADNQAIADAYDKVPYQSKPFAQSTPEQLAIMATLFGLQPPDIHHARVLELGCSAGGNIIPLAAKYPGLQALGLDLSKVQIDYGQEIIDRMALSNCTLKVLDIVNAQSEIKGQFDYIICHGVFSWVPQAVRHAILDIVRDHLSPHGVAYVSYNVYPGWKQREVIREMMMFHAGNRSAPAERLQQAKAILEYTKNISTEQSTYGKLLRDEAIQVSRAQDYYLYHEYLEIENNPMYFKDFIGLASARNLTYLGEAGLADMAPQRLGNEVHDTLSRISGGNILATEQYMDFFTNRTFRQTLLVHAAQAAMIDRNISAQSLKIFSFNTNLVVDTAFTAVPGQAPLAQFKDAAGRSVGINTQLTLEMVHALVDAQPSGLQFEVLLETLRVKVPGLAANSADAICNAVGLELMNLLVQNMVRLSLAPLKLPEPSDTPLAYALARVQAELGQDWATNLLHQPVSLSVAHRAVLVQLDGKTTESELVAELLAQLQDGRLTAHQGTQRITNIAQLAGLAQQFYTQAIADLRQLAVLQ
jgi:methyltransferase-like protein/SAM-dependent methyltransferase